MVAGTAAPEISSRYILRRAPPATHLNHPLISRRKESNIDKSLKIRQPGIDRKVSLSAPAPRVKNTCMWRRRAAYARPTATHHRHKLCAAIYHYMLLITSPHLYTSRINNGNQLCLLKCSKYGLLRTVLQASSVTAVEFKLDSLSHIFNARNFFNNVLGCYVLSAKSVGNKD